MTIFTSLPRLLAVLLAGVFTGIAATTTANADSVGIQQIAFSKDSKQILYISNRLGSGQRSPKPVIQFIDSQSGKHLRSTTLSLNPQKQLVMGFTPDGFKLAVLEDQGLSILHNQTGETLRTLPIPHLPNPASRYRPTQAITNASGTQQVFKAFRKDQLIVIHTGNGKRLAEIELPSKRYRTSGISRDGRLVAYLMGGEAGQNELHLYDIYAKKVKHTYYLPDLGQQPNSKPISFSSDGRFVVAESILVDLTHNLEILAPVPVKLAMNQNAAVTSIFTPNARYLLLPQRNNSLIRYDLVTKKRHTTDLKIPAHCKIATAFDVSPNGAWIAIGHQCNVGRNKPDYISLLNANTGQLIRNLQPMPET